MAGQGGRAPSPVLVPDEPVAALEGFEEERKANRRRDLWTAGIHGKRYVDALRWRAEDPQRYQRRHYWVDALSEHADMYHIYRENVANPLYRPLIAKERARELEGDVEEGPRFRPQPRSERKINLGELSFDQPREEEAVPPSTRSAVQPVIGTAVEDTGSLDPTEEPYLADESAEAMGDIWSRRMEGRDLSPERLSREEQALGRRIRYR